MSSRLDFCNSLLSGIAETDFTKLQRVLNRLARVVTKSPPFTRSVPLLRSLHWLPIKYRVHFKIRLLTYKALHEEQPVYLRSLIAISLPPLSLRSNRGITLSILGLRPTLAQGPSAHVPLLSGTAFHYLCVQPPRLAPSEDVSKHTFSTWPSPVDTGVPNCLLMLRNDFNDCAEYVPCMEWNSRFWRLGNGTKRETEATVLVDRPGWNPEKATIFQLGSYRSRYWPDSQTHTVLLDGGLMKPSFTDWDFFVNSDTAKRPHFVPYIQRAQYMLHATWGSSRNYLRIKQ